MSRWRSGLFRVLVSSDKWMCAPGKSDDAVPCLDSNRASVTACCGSWRELSTDSQVFWHYQTSGDDVPFGSSVLSNRGGLVHGGYLCYLLFKKNDEDSNRRTRREQREVSDNPVRARTGKWDRHLACLSCLTGWKPIPRFDGHAGITGDRNKGYRCRCVSA